MGIDFFDDFNDNSIDVAKWTKTNSTDVTITESSQKLNFASDASYSGSLNIATMVSVPTFDFRGCGLVVSIPAVGLGSGAVSAGMECRISDTGNGNNLASIALDQNTVTYKRSNNGTNSQTTEAYSATNTAWKIQNNSDNTYTFYALVSGVWTLKFTSAAANWTPSSCSLTLYGYIYGSSGQSRTTSYDDVYITRYTGIPAHFQSIVTQ